MQDSNQEKSREKPLALTAESLQDLLRYTANYLWSERKGLPLPEEPKEELFQASMGCFVTFKQGVNRALRGCIGRIQSNLTLIQNARDMSIAAASQDRRFSPISDEELKSTQMSITVLSPLVAWPHPIRPEDIELGKEGLCVELESKRGILLPQVAVEWGFDALAFLEATCKKASLEIDDWRKPECKVSRFSGWEASAAFSSLISEE